MLLPLNIPAGVFSNGTPTQAKGRWIDVNLVRWHEGVMKPLGGWRDKFEDDVLLPARGALAWKSNANAKYFATGDAENLYAYSETGSQYNISPADLAEGNVDATFPDGYGNFFYGLDFWGVQRPESDSADPATSWSLQPWGQFLLACSDFDGRVLEWDNNIANLATVVSNAPVDNQGIFVTQERFLFCLGAGGNPKLVQWADRETLTDWTPLATNEAGDLELQTDGVIQVAGTISNQTLIVTTTDAHIATYQGSPYVYGFERVGSSCGIISKQALGIVDTGAFWMGRGQFYVYAGSGVQNLPCDVSDHIFDDINLSQVSKVACVTNARFSEVIWFYPSEQSSENDRYVTYNYASGVWYYGVMGRTTGVDASVFRSPIWVDSDKSIKEHEVGHDYDGSSPYAESAPIELGNGDNVMYINSMIPDEKTQGDVSVRFISKFYPNGDETQSASYSMSNPTDLRVSGRLIRLRVTGQENTDWRVGINKVDVVQGGKR